MSVVVVSVVSVGRQMSLTSAVDIEGNNEKPVIHDLRQGSEDSKYGDRHLLDGFINPKLTTRRRSRELVQPDGSVMTVELSEKPRALPYMILYDTIGQETYQQITQMEDEYYLSSCEKRILETKGAEIASHIPDGASIFDLGCGSMERTKILVDHARQIGKKGIKVYGVDIDRPYLEAVLTGLIQDQRKNKAPHEAEFEFFGLYATFEQSIPFIKKTTGPRVLLSMGGTIGDKDHLAAHAFLREFHEKSMSSGDSFFLGFDKRKDPKIIARAYQDSKGLFNMRTMRGLETLNAMFKQNSITNNNFDIVCGYDVVDGLNERFYRSLVDQTIKIPPPFSGMDDESVEVHLKQDELISIVTSYKYSQKEVEELAAAVNFTLEGQWSDPRDLYWFCVLKSSNEDEE